MVSVLGETRIRVFPRTVAALPRFGVSAPGRRWRRQQEVAMKPILLATDGSPSAMEATREALELARMLHAPLVTVAVEHVSLPTYGYYGYAEVYSELRKADAEHVAHVLADVEQRAEELGIDCTVIATEGPVVEEVLRVARERNAAMIVVGAHGWGPIRRLVFGSVSLGILHDAPCPVLVARPVESGETTWVDEHRVAAPVAS
jgi:nucleotide-binding universal stress UspA family protein